jgi:hypothetical protein
MKYGISPVLLLVLLVVLLIFHPCDAMTMTTSLSRGGMRLFLDTADGAEWERQLPLGIFYGITTNPTLCEVCAYYIN